MTLKTDLRTLATSSQDVLIRLASRNRDAIGKLWNTVDSLDDIAQQEFARLAAQLTESAQAEAVRISSSYFAEYESLATGERVRPRPDVRAALSEARQGTTALEAYLRPMVQARVAIAEGTPFRAAMRSAGVRARGMADTDVMLAARAAGRREMERSSRIVGYRRLPDADACDFCLMASTQRYRVEDLMPIHNRCHCTIMPIIGNIDPGRVIDKERLEHLKVKTSVREHGELGPVLTNANHDFAKVA